MEQQRGKAPTQGREGGTRKKQPEILTSKRKGGGTTSEQTRREKRVQGLIIKKTKTPLASRKGTEGKRSTKKWIKSD